MPKNILVYVDHFQGQPLPASWEAIGAARGLADEMGAGVSAVVLGSGIEDIADSAFHHGADDVLMMDDEALKDFIPEAYAAALSGSAQEAEILLLPTSGRTRELAAMVAVDLETGLAPDVIAMKIQDGVIVATRPIYAGKLLTNVICKDRRPQILTLRSRAFSKLEPDTGRSGEVIPLQADLGDINTQVVGYAEAETGVSLSDAAVIVSGGRGVSNNPSLEPPADITDEHEQEIWRAQQGFKLVTDLAEVLGAAVGASRAAVDAGYVPYANQVGETGKVVAPDLYIACGISGAIQHIAGMRTSKTIVAINKDAEAPIFKLARFGVVGDLFEFLPALTTAFKSELGK